MEAGNRILRVSDGTAKLYVRFLQGFFVVSFVVLTLESVWVQLDFHVSDAREKVLWINLACGAFSLCLLCTYGVVSYVDYRRTKLVCKVPPRTARIYHLVIIDFAFLLCVVIMFIAMDVYLLSYLCGWLYSSSEIVSFLKWSFINAIVSNQFCHVLSMLPSEAIVRTVEILRLGWFCEWRGISLTDGIDLPSSVYVFVFLVFFMVPFICLLFGLFTAVGVIGGIFCSAGNEAECLNGLSIQSCEPWGNGCSAGRYSNGRSTLMIIACTVIIFNLAAYIISLIFLARSLRPMPFRRFKRTLMRLGYHIMTRIPMSLLLTLNFVFLWLIEIDSCPVEFMSSSGFGSLILALAAVSSCSLWIETPVAHGADHEDGKILFDKKSDDDKLAPNEDVSFSLMLESFVYSYMVYEIEEMPRHQMLFDLEEYMVEFGLEEYDVLWNKHVDSKCMIGWNLSSGKIIMSFRGTASGRNVLSDLKIWREPHLPERGHYWLGTQPMVHAGFSEFFFRSGMRKDCLERIEDIMRKAPGVEHWNILMSGHSLGGAAARIASYDISEWLNAKRVTYKLACYTYGCPRVGNSAFAECYNEMVPDTWSIMHLDDAVTKGGKFVYMYKRGGRHCFLTEGGPIVRPSYTTRVTLRGIKASFQRHLLPAYGASLVHTVTKPGLVDWQSPERQRVRLAVLNGKVFKHLQKIFSDRKRAIDPKSLDIDIATGMSDTRVHRLDSTTLGASDEAVCKKQKAIYMV
jgi:hypothetical protein